MPVRLAVVARTVIAVGVLGLVVAACTACTGTTTSSESWSDPSVVSRSSRVLMVMAHGTNAGDGACSPLVHLEAIETNARVIVRAVTSRPTFSNANCAAVVSGPRPFSVRLKHALGERLVVDAHTGAVESLLDGSELPPIVGLPAGYVQRTLFHDQRGAITRSWSVHADVSYPGVTLTVGPTGSSSIYPGSRTVTVDGKRVEIWSDGGDTSQNFAASWSPKSDERAQITVSAPTGRWNETETLALVTQTKRL